MSYQISKTGEITFTGFEQGIASSPHKGIANIQGGNISTEIGEVMSSYNRVAQLNSSTASGTLTPLTSSTVSFSTSVQPGQWFTIGTDSGTGLSGSYYYLGSNQIATTYNGAPITNIITNTATTVVYLTSGTTWTVPSDWNNALNTIETIGAGGAGAVSGGGGGAYSKISNLTLSPGSVTYQVGVGGTSNGATGTDTWFNGASLAASSVGAKGGGGGISGAGSVAGGAGGLASSGIGTTKYSGGNGGVASGASSQGSGGGGAAGLNGAGGVGVAAGSGGAGGQGDNGHGGAGGTGGSTGANGGNGTEYDASHGSGGGGGGININGTAGTGGLYGGGGGGIGDTSSNQGNGANGLIRITYVFSTVNTSATYSVASIGNPLQSAIETYYDSSNNVHYRYFIQDSLGNILMHDSAISSPVWPIVQLAPTGTLYAPPSGLSVLNGWVSYSRTFVQGTYLYWISTVMPGIAFDSNTKLLSNATHATLVGHAGAMYYTDGRYIGSIEPDSSLVSGIENIQSYCSYTSPVLADNTRGQITAIISGSIPYDPNNSTVRIPVVFYTPGTLASALSVDTLYYLIMDSTDNVYFKVYAAASGGSALDITTGASGAQYFNTFYPASLGGSTYGGQATITVTPQALILPSFETAQCMAEVGSQVFVGGNGNALYIWDQIDTQYSSLVPLPENNTVNIITANNMAYVFAGQKGNIYICNGSSASVALSVPDYCAGLPGTPSSYIEPYFSWGGAMFMRGRMWFSIQDQTSTKTGNCGGIWSFVPTNNLYIGQDTGQALRLENQSSYGTYNGASTILLPNQIQTAIGPQFWAGWYSSITSPSYGIDYSDVIPTTQTLIETDLVPTGTLLVKKTYSQLEYKLATPLVAGETIGIKYRQNGTDAYSSPSSVIAETTSALSGYFTVNFQGGQWLQLQIMLNPNANTSSSFCRLTQIIAR